MSVDQARPRVGCGAAILQNEKLLLVRRRRAPEAGCWGLPGGKVDTFEKVADAVAREILEELGIIIQPKMLLCVVDQIDREAGEHWVAPVFRVDQYVGTPMIMEPEALSEMGWFKLDEAPTPLTESTRQALAVLRHRA